MKRISLLPAIALLLCMTAEAADVTIVAYRPAPGQFVNTMPKATADDDSASMAAAAQKLLERNSMINLGGFGGYVTAKFNAPITNAAADDYDFVIEGNSFDGSSEPGVVWVSEDVNKNGLPDDPWYELYGSEAERSTRNYTITYYRPNAADDESKAAVEQYIRWEDNQGGSGYIPKNTFHKQSYYPMWIDEASITFSGTLLPDNGEFTNGQWVLKSYDWGYADNKPNTDTEGNSFKIEWARNEDGTPANLTSVDFVKIQTGINKINGTIGENSTEITDIRPIRESDTPSAITTTTDIKYSINPDICTIRFDKPVAKAAIVNMIGRTVATYADTDMIDFNALTRGVYICVTPQTTFKFIKK